jgi:hypothetical protein
VIPNVEVKRADLAEVTPSDDGKQQQAEGAPPVVVAPKPADDLELKKAIEILTSGAKAKRRSA